MSVRHPLRMPGALSYGISHFPSTACMVRGTFVFASLAAATLIQTPYSLGRALLRAANRTALLHLPHRLS